jgi:aryl-alcohol dehydrogenase-like predicted oxidoreductase
MHYVTLGQSDLEVSCLCLGAGKIGVNNTEDETRRIFDTFVASGGNFIDTARVYSDWVPGEIGRSERIIGDWLRLHPELRSGGGRGRLMIATKGGHPALADPDTPRMSRTAMRKDVELSLDALGIDTIDLYYYHRDDPTLPVSELVGTMEELVAEGKIRFYGCSNWKPQRIRQAQVYAAETNAMGFVANQALWNLGSANMKPLPDRTLVRFDADAANLHRESGIAAVPYSSQAGGFFSKLLAMPESKWAELLDNPYYTKGNLQVARVIDSIAGETGTNATAVVLSYLLSQPAVTVPVVGCFRLQDLEDTLSASGLVLSANHLDALEKATLHS